MLSWAFERRAAGRRASDMPPPSEKTATIFRGAPRLPLPARIRVVGAPATPDTFGLAKGGSVVGAGSDCDVIVSDSTISRRHVELSVVPEGVQLKDLGSRNGTFYLGQRVERMTLALGSRVRLGASAELIFEADTDALTVMPGVGPSEYLGLSGASSVMRQLFATLTRLEGSLVNVLVQGESGVGKELVARALHEGSTLAAQPFVTVNCGALSRELVASELFGHKKGAFTGALEQRRGAFEEADGGTLLLDEIGELPLDVQPMLLRAIESGEVRALGSDRSRRVKVRLIAATNRVLADEVRGGRFREDLYFRLAVVTLTVAPLRDRVEDIELLASHFARLEGVPTLPPELLRELASRAWPGNVRELKNAVLAYLALGDLPKGLVLGGESDDLDSALRKLVDLDQPYADQKDAIAARFTRVYLEALMKRTGGHQTEAARLAGLDRGYLGRLLAKHGLGKG
jgi:transcriptional regulator with GAF, ATPase, and Fis domain